MKERIKIFGVLVLSGFSFFYTNKVSNIIKDNDPIMKEINKAKETMYIKKTDRITMNDEYLTGINGCVIDEKNSYNKMKNQGEYKKELLVMKEDEIKKDNYLYIVGGNKEKRNVSIILLNINDNINKYVKKNNIKINYFLDGKYITNNLDTLINISKYSNIYSYGRDKKYNNKYILFDNNMIKANFNNESNYCFLEEKNEKVLKLCSSYNMKTIKNKVIDDKYLVTVKESLSSGKIYTFKNISYDEFLVVTKYILSKGYNIKTIDDLLDESNNCN